MTLNRTEQEMTPNQQLSYTVEEAAKASSMSRSRLYLAIGTGELRSFKAGRRRLITAEALREFIANLERESAKGAV